jgi:hypothetical protein
MADDDSELRMRYGYEGEEEVETKKASKPSGKLIITLAIIAAVIIAAGFAYFYLIPEQYREAALTALIIGAIAGAILWMFSLAKGKKVNIASLAANVILIFILAFAIISVIPMISPTATNLWAQVKGVSTGIGENCNILTPANLESCVGQERWNSKGTQQIESSVSVKVDWTRLVKMPSGILVPLVATTDRILKIDLQCFNEKGDLTTDPLTMTFEKSGEKPLTCSGIMTNQTGVRMKTKSGAILSVPVSVGNGAETKIVDSSEKGPYSLRIYSIEKQPFDSDQKITVELKKASQFNLTKIDSFDVSTRQGSNIDITCPQMTGSSDELKDYFKTDAYSFVCDLQIINLPEKPETSFIDAAVNYTIMATDGQST